MLFAPSQRRARLSGPALPSLALLLTLNACGGGSAPPTPLPGTLSIQAPGLGEVGDSLVFAQSAGSVGGLSYSWSFGDGNVSNTPSPSHRYARGGDYDIVLTLRNEAGESREARWRLSVNDSAHVRGFDCSGSQASGWCWQQPLPTGNRINQLYVRDASNIWRIGGLGEIFKTADGGASWQRQPTGVRQDLYDIAFSDVQNGWAFGLDGLMLRTQDGGANRTSAQLGWTEAFPLQFLATRPGLLHVLTGQRASTPGAVSTLKHRVSEDGGVSWRVVDQPIHAVADDGTQWSYDNKGNALMRSTDAGRSRQLALALAPVPAWVDPDQYLSTFEFYSKLNLLGAGRVVLSRRYGSSGDMRSEIWYSNNGGQDWTRIEPQGAGDFALQLVWMSADGRHWLAQGSQGTLRSEDGGLNWSLVALPDNHRFGQLSGHDGLLILLPRDSSDAYASLDQGHSWKLLAKPTPTARWVDVAKWQRLGDQGLVVELEGIAYHSSNLGSQWQVWMRMEKPVYGRPQEDESFWFVDPTKGWRLDGLGRLHRSTDGGRSWSLLRDGFGAGNGGVGNLQMLDESNGWLLDGNARLHRSTDGGSSWTQQGQFANVLGDPSRFATFRFEDAQAGWVFSDGYNGNRRAIWLSLDAGQSWREVPELSASYAMALAKSGNRWLAVGALGRIQLSTDNGNSWREVVAPRPLAHALTSVRFLDAQTALAAGGDSLLRSADGGLSWQPVGPQGVYFADLSFANARQGWVVGGQRVLRTDDGGLSWREQAVNVDATRSLARVQFVDSKVGWITGPGGLLISTGSGGQ